MSGERVPATGRGSNTPRYSDHEAAPYAPPGTGPSLATPPPITEPDPSALVCSGDKVGLCAECQRKTHRYGPGGSPLCQWCMELVKAGWGPSVRFTSTRP